MSEAKEQSPVDGTAAGERYDAIVVGAGFAGLYMLHRLRKLGLAVRVLEAGSGVGGTWFWNRYPGARCDVDSMEYSYQFSDELQQDWEWSERYATQPEILRYINHVADRFDLRGDIDLNTRVAAAVFDDKSGRWSVATESGRKLSAKYCVMAMGCLSAANTPKFKGIEAFAGKQYHTGNWPHEGVDFSGQRVGIIGTGSSAIQSVPLIAQQAAHLYVFQRTAAYSVPAKNAPLNPDYVRDIKVNYRNFRQKNRQMAFGVDFRDNPVSALAVSPEERRLEYEKRWSQGGLQFLAAFGDLLFNRDANATAAEFIRGKIREIVHDPAVAEKLMPSQVAGCKRLCADSGYYETFNRPNVTLVDVKAAPIQEITRDGLRTAAQGYALDSIIFATGFDAMTGALMRVDIRGKAGLSLQRKWADGPRTYLGLMTAGFPNLFIVAGPGSPSVLSNMLPSIEQHVDWIANCIAHLQKGQIRTIESTVQAEEAWVEHVNTVADTTLYPHCNSWYLGANVPGKPRVFMPYVGVPPYVARCNEVVAKGYEGFQLAR
jgi:cyclohexanone monooxygenase